jgi:hypothetical protein
LAICLAILVTHSHAQSLHLLDDFEDGDAAEWLRTDYSASRGAHEVVDGNFVITGSQRGQGQDFDWGSGPMATSRFKRNSGLLPKIPPGFTPEAHWIW